MDKAKFMYTRLDISFTEVFMNSYAQSMLEYINGSPTPYHAVNKLKDMLIKRI